MDGKLESEKNNSKITSNDIFDLTTKSGKELLPMLMKTSFGFHDYLKKISKKNFQNLLDLDEFVNILEILKVACSTRSPEYAKSLKQLLEMLMDCELFLFKVVPCVINDCFGTMRERDLIVFLSNFITVLCSILEYYSCAKIVDIFPYVRNFFNGIQNNNIRMNKKVSNHSTKSNEVLLKILCENFNCLKLLVLKQSGCEANADDEDNVKTFRDLSIVPRRNDIVNCKLPDLPMNIINKPYESVNQYLSVHFRLMREDMIRSYRECVGLCLDSVPSSEARAGFNVYESIRIGFPPEYTPEGVLYDIRIIASEVIEWTKKSILMPGSLVCLTPDSFQSVVFASVLSDLRLSSSHSKEASLKIRLEDDLYEDKLSCKMLYQIIEPNAYFESYKHVLSAIKGFSERNFPLSDFITFLDFKNPRPKYLKDSNDVRFCLHECCEKEIFDGLHPCRVFNPLDFDQWPHAEELKLDVQQFEALQIALTNKVALIQGPPGTGKTFIGVKIIKSLLYNVPHKPIVVSCLTNHALDQFLERVLKYTQNVVRLGLQSQSTALQPHVLNNICKAIREHHLSRNLLPQTLAKSLELAKEFWRLSLIKRYTGEYDRDHQALKRLCNEINSCLRLFCACKEKYLDETSLNYIIPSMHKDQLCEGTSNHSKQLTSNLMEWLCESHQKTLYERCEKYFDKFSTIVSENPIDIYETKQLWGLFLHERYRLLYIWRQTFLKMLRKRIAEALKLYEENMKIRKKEMINSERLQILQQASIIGVTTTGASKYKNLIMECSPRILIVEEAAEVLESHIIAALVPSIEHMILIGDHKQLRPLPEDHDLSENYNLKVSMFERLFLNNAPSCTLVTQHRMKPCIASLLVPEIYDELKSTEEVYQYEDIRGVESSLYFFNHSISEDTIFNSRSSSNVYESKLIVSLSQYLLAQSYSTEQITILSTYAAQVQLIKELLKEENIEIYVTTVDNYQGEENDIILISFVKSNSSAIGFLKESNRVCVALSRARKGMFCIGNFKLFASKNLLWRKIVEKLESNNVFGDTFPLLCNQHQHIKQVKSPKDIYAFLKTGCDQNCDYVLNCRHKCMRKCHSDDLDHSLYQCEMPCERYIGETEICSQKCFQPCKMRKRVTERQCGHIFISSKVDNYPEDIKCEEQISKLLPCKHIANVPCCLDVSDYECKKIVSVFLTCGHEKKIYCSKKNNLQHVICSETQMKKSPCGHIVEVPCCLTLEDDELPTFCNKICNSLLKCGHQCFNNCRLCSGTGIHSYCTSRCDKRLVCGHECSGICGSPCICTKECFLTCSHSEHCINKCSHPCTKCEKQCSRRCKHAVCNKLCFEECSIDACVQPCEEILQCGHMCCGLCSDVCPYFCRICHKSEFEFGDPNTDRYVMLHDCQHIIELNVLTSHINDCLLTMQWPDCPKCSVIIKESLRYKSQLQKAKTAYLECFDTTDEVEELKYIFHSMFGNDVVPASFLDIHENIYRVLCQETLTLNVIIILKTCILCLEKLIKINQKHLDNPDLLSAKHCELFNTLLMWIRNHLMLASHQQLFEVEVAVLKLYEKYSDN